MLYFTDAIDWCWNIIARGGILNWEVNICYIEQCNAYNVCCIKFRLFRSLCLVPLELALSLAFRPLCPMRTAKTMQAMDTHREERCAVKSFVLPLLSLLGYSWEWKKAKPRLGSCKGLWQRSGSDVSQYRQNTERCKVSCIEILSLERIEVWKDFISGCYIYYLVVFVVFVVAVAVVVVRRRRRRIYRLENCISQWKNTCIKQTKESLLEESFPVRDQYYFILISFRVWRVRLTNWRTNTIKNFIWNRSFEKYFTLCLFWFIFLMSQTICLLIHYRPKSVKAHLY